MAKGIKEYYLFLMALVVIVAAVSIVLQISNKTSCQVGVEEETLLAYNSGEIVGMAYNVGTCTDQDSVPIIDKTV